MVRGVEAAVAAAAVADRRRTHATAGHLAAVLRKLHADERVPGTAQLQHAAITHMLVKRGQNAQQRTWSTQNKVDISFIVVVNVNQ